jgi:hypothetical protein
MSARTLGDRWVLADAPVGGGMSDVYPAFDRRAEYSSVAVKLLPAPRATDRYAVKACDIEYRARLAPLDHPNIVPLLDGGRGSSARTSTSLRSAPRTRPGVGLAVSNVTPRASRPAGAAPSVTDRDHMVGNPRLGSGRGLRERRPHPPSPALVGRNVPRTVSGPAAVAR